MIKARVDEQRWLRCGKCSHKLMRIVGDGTFPMIEIKCHSCKEINLWQMPDSIRKASNSLLQKT